MPLICIDYSFYYSEEWFISNCRFCEKKRREIGENWPWKRRKLFTGPVFVWHFPKLMLQPVNGNLSLDLRVYLYPLRFGLSSWKNCLVRNLCCWIVLTKFEPTNHYYKFTSSYLVLVMSFICRTFMVFCCLLSLCFIHCCNHIYFHLYKSWIHILLYIHGIVIFYFLQ